MIFNKEPFVLIPKYTIIGMKTSERLVFCEEKMSQNVLFYHFHNFVLVTKIVTTHNREPA